MIALMCMTMAAQAQLGVKRVAKLQKGDKAVYRTEQSIGAANAAVKVTATEQYVVTDATADGFVVENTATGVESDAAADDIMGTLAKKAAEVMKGITIRFSTDKEGKPMAILNGDELMKTFDERANTMVNELHSSFPEIAQMLPKETLKKQLTEHLTTEALLASLTENAGVFALNGKTIMTGAMDEYVNDDGMKMKRMYFLTEKDASKVKVTGNINMNKEELKSMVLKELEENMPADQVEAVKQNIDMVMANMKMDVKETTDYEFFPNGWLKTATTETNSEMMGQASSSKKTIECVEHSWK